MNHRFTRVTVSFAPSVALVAALAAAGCSSSDTASSGCTKDSDCKGDRICSLAGRCIDPAAATGAGGSGGAMATGASGTGGEGAASSGATTTASTSTATASTGGGMMCGAGLTFCGGTCVDTKVDAANCGACGQACGANVPCVNAKCSDPACAAHSPCSAGTKLPASCNTCTTKVCEKDVYCCTTEWDTTCVNLAKTVLACMCP